MFEKENHDHNEERNGRYEKKTQIEILDMKNTLSEMKTSLVSLNSKLHSANEKIRKTENIAIKCIKIKHRGKKEQKNKTKQRKTEP